MSQFQADILPSNVLPHTNTHFLHRLGRKKIDASQADKWRVVKLPQPLQLQTIAVAIAYGYELPLHDGVRGTPGDTTGDATQAHLLDKGD